jgi:hypothetical protein
MVHRESSQDFLRGQYDSHRIGRRGIGNKNFINFLNMKKYDIFFLIAMLVIFPEIVSAHTMMP